eukprot:scaffold481589_cov23-Prasinocladus_malaysianus.AAC.1
MKQAAGNLSDVYLSNNTAGNPVHSSTVRDYLDGYEAIAFEDYGYRAQSAVPMLFSNYEALVLDLLKGAHKATDPMTIALYYQDA